MTKPNGVATASDFRALAEAKAWTDPENLTLPVWKKTIKVRRPTRFYWALRRTTWPSELRFKLDMAAAGQKPEYTKEEQYLLITEDRDMVREAFVDPKPSFEPGENQFDPYWLDPRDTDFIIRYLGGQVTSSGVDLEGFPGSEREPATDGGGHGTAVRKVPNGGPEPTSADLPHQ
jgi:hypothetical protein